MYAANNAYAHIPPQATATVVYASRWLTPYESNINWISNIL